jgi:hypothetical protein
MNPLFQVEYVVLTAALLSVAGMLLAWRAAARCRPFRRLTIVVLRGLALAGFGWLALNPGRWERETTGYDKEWVLMVDRSRSMATADVAGRSRWTEARRLAGKAVTASGRRDHVSVQVFAGQAETMTIDGMASGKPDGELTDIVTSGRALLARYRSGARRLSGVVLLSDGRQTRPAAVTDLAAESRAQQAPFYVIPLGGDVPRKDVSLSVIRRQMVAFAGQKVKVGVRLRNEGAGLLAVPVELRDAENRVIASQKVDVAEGVTVTVQFTLAPGEPGYGELECSIPRYEGEATVVNNSVRFGLSVLRNKLRVLVVEGNPGWESKFLVQLLRAQANLQVSTVYRLSAERFFKVETDLADVRESETALFPDSAEALGNHDLIVFGKGVEYFLTPERISLLRGFVHEQGGCVVFFRGKPYRGDFPELEFLEPVTWGDGVGTPLQFVPGRQAEGTGLFGEMLAAGGDPVWGKLPPLQSVNRVAGLKAFSRVLAEGALESAGHRTAVPVLISRRFGKGLVVTVNAEGFWQWDFFPSVPEASEIYKELWPQLVLWAATYSEFLPGQDYALRLSGSSTEPGAPVTVWVTGRSGKPGAPPQVRIHSAGRVLQTLVLSAAGQGERRWTAQTALTEPGLYRVELAVPEGDKPSDTFALLEVRPPPGEGDNLSADRVFLETLARQSGGAVIDEKDLPAIVGGLEKPEESRTSGRSVWVPLWNRGWVLGVLLALFAMEWVIRRRSGLL